MLPRSSSHCRTRLVTRCPISAAGNSQSGGVLGPIFGDQRAGDIVAVPRVLLDCVAWRHPVAVAIKQHAGEETWLASSCARVALGGVAGKLRLDRIPQRQIDDRRVVARMGLSF